MDTYVFIPADLEEQKILATGIYGAKVVKVNGNYDDVNRLCTELSGERDWAFVNVNVRPYYAEGSKTLGYEIAEQLGWEVPDRVVAPIASGSLYTKIAQGLPGLPRPRPRRTARAPVDERRAGRRLLAGGQGVRGRRRLLQAGAARHDRQVAGHRQPGRRPYALDLARRSGGAIDSVSDDEIRARHPPAGRDHRHLHRDRRRRDHRGAGQARRARRHRPDERVVVVITGEGLKTLDAVAARSRRSRSSRPSTSSCRGRGRGGARPDAEVKLPTQLREAAGGESAVSVEGATVGAVLDALFERHGELRDRLSDGDGGCAASSTSTSTARTSASATGSRRRSPTGRRSRSCLPSRAADAETARADARQRIADPRSPRPTRRVG
jgi:molybdopterin converting factor small subunit